MVWGRCDSFLQRLGRLRHVNVAIGAAAVRVSTTAGAKALFTAISHLLDRPVNLPRTKYALDSETIAHPEG
jgi:hypothetical protein